MRDEKGALAPWRIEQAGPEKEELVEAGAIGREHLQSSMVYSLVTPSTERLANQDKVSLVGTMTCACGYQSPFGATLGFEGFLDAPSKHFETCLQCRRGTMLVGETTGTDDAKKHWLLLIPTIGKPSAVEMP